MLGQPLRTMAALTAAMLAMGIWPCSNAELTSVHHLQRAELVYKEFTSFQQQVGSTAEKTTCCLMLPPPCKVRRVYL